MKLNIKSLLIIFLVALLGSGIGTFGVLEYRQQTSTAPQSDIQVRQVTYAPDAEKNQLTEAIDKAYDTVVEISATKKTRSYFGSSESTSLGSGVIITEDGYIVTNHHVVESATAVKVKLSSGETFAAEIIGSDSRTDIALLKIEAKGLRYSSFVDSDKLEMGQSVIVIGNPLGEGVTCSTGIISALEKEILLNNVYMDLIQTDASVNEGNSGGGLFDINGDLVGVINSKSSSSYYSSATVEGMGYAIPANRVLWVIESLKEYGYVKDRATLGVTVSTSSNSYFYNGKTGLLVTGVVEGGGAANAGIKENDLIVKVDDTEISSYALLNKVLGKHSVGDSVEVIVQRDNAEISFTVTLTEAYQ